ncbi:MAG TPA: GUN4 domain-containing protein [Oculatellaceae cyanobacterium]
MNNKNRYYEILDLEQTASLEEVKQAYKDLAYVWHPDRYSHNPRLQKKAEEKFKKVNQAYEILRSCLTTSQNQTSPPQYKSEQPPSQAQPDNLNSAVGADYSKLRYLLAVGKWQEADRETSEKMLWVALRDKSEGLRGEDIERFPCEDLRTIDQLWLHYSNGRFGFSVQKCIWESVGGKDNPDWKTYERFGDRLGWRRKSTWLPYSNLTLTKNAPEGHLPVCKLVTNWWWSTLVTPDDMVQWQNLVISLLERVESCNL